MSAIGMRSLAAALLIAAIASCAPRREPPAPPPPPPPPPVQPQRPPPPPPPLAWQDSPLTPGDWTYQEAGPAAVYGTGAASFVVRCESGRVSLARPGASGSVLTIRTTETARSLAATVEGGALVARVGAADPLLDAMAFSRGRIAVEAPGAPLLIVPSWPEPARVVEECRR